MSAVLAVGWVWWLALPLSAFLLVYFAAGQSFWTIVGFGLLALYSYGAAASWWVKLLVWLLFLVPYVILGVAPVRRPLISERLLARFRDAMLPMSETEQAAVAAGTVWWDAELFSGRPRWRRLLQLGPNKLGEAERAFMEGPVDALCAQLDDYAINHTQHDLPDNAWAAMLAHGFFGLAIPQEHGGKGFSAAGVAAVIAKVASRSASAALIVSAASSWVPAKLLLTYATAEQKARFLPRIARGEELPCLALTSTDAGSDAAGLTDTGTVVRADDGALALRLDFEKRYVTLAPHASLVMLVFKLHDPEHLLGSDAEPGITIALVDARAPGVERARHELLHLGCPHGLVRGRSVLVPVDAIIGGAAGAGQGWRMLVELASDARALAIPSLCSGAARRACRVAGAYARIRYQFNTYLGQFEGVQELLARIAGHSFAIESVRQLALTALAAGERPFALAACVKLTCTERWRQISQDSIDLLGGGALFLGPRNLLGEYQGLATVGATFEGGNVWLRNVVIFAQGAVRCHPYLRAELDAAAERDSGRAMAQFDRVCIKHIGFVLSNALRTVTLALSAGWLAPLPMKTGSLVRHYQRLSRYCAAFAFATDVLLLAVRGELRRRERLCARMADILTELHVASAALLCAQAAQDEAGRLPARWVLQDCNARIGRSFDELCANLPQRWLGVLLRRAIFPLRRLPRRPRDALDAKLARVLLVPSSARDRMSAGMYLPSDPREPLARLEAALELVIRSTPALRKLRDAARVGLIGGDTVSAQLESAYAAGVLNADEAQLLREAEAARREALTVDAFPA